MTQIETKHLVLYFHDEALENLISRFDWGGRISGNICAKEEGCNEDYLMLVDANLGVNKANYFINRRVSHKIYIDDDLVVKEKTEITYQNTSQSEGKLEGTYKNYLRLYAPLNSELVNIQLDDKEEVTKIDKVDELGKTSYGFSVSVPPKTTSKISISYNLKRPLSFDSRLLYKLAVQKQIGSKNDDYVLDIYYPKILKAKGITSFSQPLDKDQIFTFSFTR